MILNTILYDLRKLCFFNDKYIFRILVRAVKRHPVVALKPRQRPGNAGEEPAPGEPLITVGEIVGDVLNSPIVQNFLNNGVSLEEIAELFTAIGKCHFQRNQSKFKKMKIQYYSQSAF